MHYMVLLTIDAGTPFDTINCNVIRNRGHPLRIIKQYCNVNNVVPVHLYVVT